jgi:hypothetical protein
MKRFFFFFTKDRTILLMKTGEKMKKPNAKIIFSLLIILFVSSFAFAQFNFPKLPKDGKNKSTNPADKETAPKNNRLPALVYDKPFQPSIIMGKFLNNLRINSGGYLVIGNFNAAFLPDKDVSGKDVFYGTGQDNHAFTAILSKDGVKTNELDFRASVDLQTRVFWQVESLTQLFQVTAGNYNF